MFPAAKSYSINHRISETDDPSSDFNYKGPDWQDYSTDTRRVNRMALRQVTGGKVCAFHGFEVIGEKVSACDARDFLAAGGIIDQGIENVVVVLRFPKDQVERPLIGEPVIDWGDNYILFGLKPDSKLRAKLIKERRILHLDYFPSPVPETEIYESAIYIPLGLVSGLQTLADRLF